MIEKKENVLCTRVDDGMLEYIKEYSKQYNISTSKLLREAVAYYLQYAQKDENSVAPMILFAKGEFSCLINKFNETEIKELADSSYDTALRGITNYIKKRAGREINPRDIGIRSLLRIIVTAIFDYDAQNWFNNISYSTRSHSLTFAGTHSFNKNFSIYLKYFLSRFFEVYSYKLQKENIQENKIHLIYDLESGKKH